MAMTKVQSEVKKLTKEVIEMVDMVSNAYIGCLDALEKEDHVAARKIAENDSIINAKEEAIEKRCMGIMATLAPKASDLRAVTGFLKINNELERIGDYAKKISKMVSKTNKNRLALHFDKIKKLMEDVIEMLSLIKQSIESSDPKIAYKVVAIEEEIDEIFRGLVQEIVGNEKICPQEVINLFLASKELERSGDHLVNICENLIFIYTGDKIDLE